MKELHFGVMMRRIEAGVEGVVCVHVDAEAAGHECGPVHGRAGRGLRRQVGEGLGSATERERQVRVAGAHVQRFACAVPMLRDVQPAAQSRLTRTTEDMVAASARAPVHGGRVDHRHTIRVVPISWLLVAQKRQTWSFIQYFALVWTCHFSTRRSPPPGIF